MISFKAVNALLFRQLVSTELLVHRVFLEASGQLWFLSGCLAWMVQS